MVADGHVDAEMLYYGREYDIDVGYLSYVKEEKEGDLYEVD